MLSNLTIIIKHLNLHFHYQSHKVLEQEPFQAAFYHYSVGKICKLKMLPEPLQNISLFCILWATQCVVRAALSRIKRGVSQQTSINTRSLKLIHEKSLIYWWIQVRELLQDSHRLAPSQLQCMLTLKSMGEIPRYLTNSSTVFKHLTCFVKFALSFVMKKLYYF